MGKLGKLTFFFAAAIALFSAAIFYKLQRHSLAEAKPPHDNSGVINLNHGDPKMYEPYWRAMGERGEVGIPAWQTMSYFSKEASFCWFMEGKLGGEIVRLHRLVGNAITEGKHIVVGTGSSQLFQAALYALSSQEASKPLRVVSAAPFYSSYPTLTDYLRSGFYYWAGDAQSFHGDVPFVEIVCSPNNPDGFMMEPVVKGEDGYVVYDLAYYWPQYAPISAAADHDLMLFTFSKITGHAGTRIGWALVKDKEIAEKMTKFIELNTIGVSKDSQLRAARILGQVSDGYEGKGGKKFFDFSRRVMADRWSRLREAINATRKFTVPVYDSGDCKFTGERTPILPAFAWLRCENGVDDCEDYLRSIGLLTRGGKHFGWDRNYARVSMLDSDENFNIFIHRINSLCRVR